MKASELREMSDEQLKLTLAETCDRLFRLRIQSQTERLDAPSEIRRQRRLVAQTHAQDADAFGYLPEGKRGRGREFGR